MASSFSLVLDDLYEDLLETILGFAASASIQDLHSLRRVSKKFKRLSYRRRVLCQASLDISMLPLNQYEWDSVAEQYIIGDYIKGFTLYVEQYDDFVQRCLRYDNPQAPMALFDLGLRQYVEASLADRNQRERGLRNLADAADRGITDAIEFYGVILICQGGEHRQKGFEILRPLRIPLIPSEVLQTEERWRSHVRRFRWSLRPGFMVYYLIGHYLYYCNCDGLTSRWFASASQGLGRFDQFAGMPMSMACEACLWNELFKRLYRL